MYAMNQLKTFADIQYVRPDFTKIPLFYGELNARLQGAKSYEDVRQCIF